MQPIEQHITTEQELAYKRYVERRRSHLARQITSETLSYMEEEFQT